MEQFLNKRIWHKELGLCYFCPVCGKYKPEKEFYKRKKGKWGVESTCKIHFSKRDKDDKGENDHIKFNKVTEQDFIGARILLQKMGYDTTKDVHQQFLKKFKLK